MARNVRPRLRCGSARLQRATHDGPGGGPLQLKPSLSRPHCTVLICYPPSCFQHSLEWFVKKANEFVEHLNEVFRKRPAIPS